MTRSVFTIIAILTIATACKREDDDDISTLPAPTAPVCRITSAEQAYSFDTVRYRFSYNSIGKISIVKTEDITSNFTYAGNTIYISYSNGARDTLTLGGNGLIAERRYTSPPTSTPLAFKAKYTYNGAQVSRAINTYRLSGNFFSDTVRFTWSGGNLARQESSANGFSDYTYYADKLAPATGGDLVSFDQLTLGATYIKNKNLVETIRFGNGSETTLTPVLNADGTISQIIYNDGGGTTFTTRYGYACQ